MPNIVLRITALFLVATSLLAQEPSKRPPERPSFYSHAVREQVGVVEIPAASFWHGLFHRDELAQVTVKFDKPLRGYRFSCWMDDSTDRSFDVRVLTLTATEVTIEAPRGHTIFWSAGGR